ncbi:MAG: hypothetical protein ACOCWG_00160 [bacterium]
MKLKDILTIENKPKIKLHKKYEDFVNDPYNPINAIEIDENRYIISDQLSVLNFIQFLLHEYEYLPEKRNNGNLKGEEKSKKKKSKKSKKRKRIKTIKQFVDKNDPSNNSNNYDPYRNPVNLKDFNTDRYFNQPFSASSGSPENIPNIESQE